VRITPVWANTHFTARRAAGSLPGGRARKAIPADGFAAVACIRTGGAAVFDDGTDLR